MRRVIVTANMVKSAATLFLLLVVLFMLGACGTSEQLKETPNVQDVGENNQAVSTALPEASPPEASPQVDGLENWTGWDEATLQGYLTSKLAYALVNEGYYLSGEEGSAVNKRIHNFALDQFRAVVDDIAIQIDVNMDELIPGDTDTFSFPSDLYVGQAETALTEEEWKARLCQSTESDLWYSVNTFETDWGSANMPYDICVNIAQFNTNGTCELQAGILWTDEVSSIKGTYTVNGDRLSIQLMSIQEWVEIEGSEGYESVSVPDTRILEYQLLPTQTGMAFVQISETSFSYADFVGAVLSWQKGYPIDYSKPSLLIPAEATPQPTEQINSDVEIKDKPTGQLQDASELYNTSWTYRTAPGPFGLILNADGTYYASDYVMEEINWNGYWEYVGGKLYIDGEEFTVATSSDGTISFFSDNASIY